MALVQPLTFGNLLKRYRRAAGFTQEELAQRAKLSVRGISDLERGVNHAPHSDTLLALMEALQLLPHERSTLENAARFRDTSALLPRGEAFLTPSETARSPFVGRTREIALMDRCLAGSGPPLLLLAGEPGIGKTRLLQEVGKRASDRGWRILQGASHRVGEQAPFSPLLEALENYVHTQPADRLHSDLEGCGWLARLLPELIENAMLPLPRWTLPPEQERRLMFASIRRFVAQVAGPAGTLLLLDDLQWADADACDLLATLLRSPVQTPLRVIGAYRSTDVGIHDHLTATLSDLAHDRLAIQVQVGPLATQEAMSLLDSLLQGIGEETSMLATRLQERCGGVPFFLVSCAQTLRAGVLEDEAARVLPWDVAQSIAQRLTLLTDAARELLHTAAVAGQQIKWKVLIALGTRPGQSDEEVLAAVEALCQARLLEETGEGVYIFAHDLIREAVLADLSAARRALLHQRVAEVLEHQPGEPPVAALAHHYQQAGNLECALAYLERACDQAVAIHATAEAARYFQALVECLDALGCTIESARARTKLGRMLCTDTCYDQATEVLEQAAKAFDTVGAIDERWRTLAQIGHVYAQQGRPEVGLARLEPDLKAIKEPRPSPGLAELHAALAMLYYFTGRFAQQLVHAEQATHLAGTLGDEALLVQTQHVWGLALLMAGRFEEGLQVEEEVISLAEQIGDLSTLARALNNVGYLYGARGAHEQSKYFLARALQAAELLEDQGMIAYIANNLSQR